MVATVTVLLSAMALPGQTLRQSNHVEWRFASRKLEPSDARVADTLLSLAGNAKILADDQISGILAIHERHPPLVNVRAMYLTRRSPNMSHAEYVLRTKLAQFAAGDLRPGTTIFRTELSRLNVDTTALKTGATNYDAARTTLLACGFHLAARSGVYAIWTKTAGHLSSCLAFAPCAYSKEVQNMAWRVPTQKWTPVG